MKTMFHLIQKQKSALTLVLLAVATASWGQGATDELTRISEAFSSLNLKPSLYQRGCLDNPTGTITNSGEIFTETALRSLREGICLVHSSDPKDAGSAEKAASQLAWAQSAGLPINVQNYASFLEGLSYCRIAQNAEKRNLQDPKFCTARKAALNAFQAVGWDTFSVRYRQTDAPDSPENETVWFNLLNEMTTCYKDTLIDEYDAACGLNAGAMNFASTVEAEANAVFEARFEGASSPIDAIIQRKIQVSRGVLSKAEEQLGVETDPASLLGRADYVRRAFESAENIIGPLDGVNPPLTSLDGRVTALKKNYQEAILSASEIVGEYNRLQKGLFFDGKKDWDLEMSQQANTMMAQVKEAKSSWKSGASRWERTQSVPKLLLDMLKYGQDRKQTIKQMCQLYFCELTQQTNLVTGGSTQKACRDPRSDETPGVKNPLCPRPGEKAEDLAFDVSMDNGESVKVNIHALCTEVGFPARYAALSLKKPDAKSCFAATL
jgi:hypothetical protein